MINLFGEEKKEIVQEKIFDNFNESKLFPEIENKSFNVDKERIEKLKELFPNIVSDNKIDWKTLKLMLGENVTEDDERYRFTWSGKSKAIREISIPTSNTLRPCKDEINSKNWNTTENLYIEGDNLEVLKILQNSYNGKIKMIYIDPPYNTGNDFIYNDDFTLTAEEAERQEGLKDKKGVAKTADRLTKNTKDSAKYHTNWLNMMYPRLSIARDLLTEDGVIFISIDDNEVHNLRKICDEIFGENNLIGNLIWESTTQPINSGSAKFNLQKKTEHILSYSKNKTKRKEFNLKEIEGDLKYPHSGKFGNCRFEIIEKSDSGTYKRETMKFEILGQFPREGKRWQIGKETAEELEALGKLEIVDGIVKKAIYPEDEIDKKKFVPFWSYLPANQFGTAQTGKEELNILFDYSLGFDTVKPTNLIKELISYFEKDIIVLDFFSGTATTAHAIMQLNSEDNGKRKFIMVQVPELSYEGEKNKEGEYIIDEKTNLPEIKKDSEARNAGFNYITEIGRERIRRAGEKILADSSDKDLSNLDIGFKTFKVDSSNFNEWDISYEAMKKAVLESSKGEFTTYKSDRSHLDLVYEIMLKEGMLLTEVVEEIKVETDIIYKIADGVMYIYLGKLNNEVIETIVSMKKEAYDLLGLDNPTVILNETYLDTETKSNSKKNFESNGIKNIKTL